MPSHRGGKAASGFSFGIPSFVVFTIGREISLLLIFIPRGGEFALGVPLVGGRGMLFSALGSRSSSRV